MATTAPVRWALLCTVTGLAACGLVASGTNADGGIDLPDASMDGARGDGSVPPRDAAGTDADAGAPDARADAQEAGCPSGLPGPALVRVDEYCIDATEVTNEQYQQFLNATADAGAPPAPCDWATVGDSYRIYGAWISGAEKRPATFMNWCGAYEYCRWAKKRLCGKRSGGGNLGNSTNDATDHTKSEWFNACSKGDTQGFPYGGTYVPTACNSGTGFAATVTTYGMCGGAYPGLYDMVGNALEWQDACDTSNGNAWDRDCVWQGGSYDLRFDTEQERRCDEAESSNDSERRDRWLDVGFRCCANP